MVGTGPRTLSLRELNRALLSRQMLLGREPTPALEAVRRLVGLQAQVPNPPYVGLWTRLQGFGREDLTRLMEERSVVRAPFVRSTLHLVAAEDYLSRWPAVQPALLRALGAFFGKKARGADVERLVSAAREALDERPLTMGGLKEVLSRVEPDRDGDALNYAMRSSLPLVQVPPAAPGARARRHPTRPPHPTSAGRRRAPGRHRAPSSSATSQPSAPRAPKTSRRGRALPARRPSSRR